jgi:hypothetical protein
MLKTPSRILRTGLLALLLPILLLLPNFHAHPEHRHTHGYDSPHSHPAVVHADFFVVSAYDHNQHSKHTEHEQGHGTPDENSSFHISLFTLLPRSFVLLTPALEGVPLAFLTAVPVITPRPLTQSWLHPSEHLLPIQPSSFPAISPRSPPRLA